MSDNFIVFSINLDEADFQRPHLIWWTIFLQIELATAKESIQFKKLSIWDVNQNWWQTFRSMNIQQIENKENDRTFGENNAHLSTHKNSRHLLFASDTQSGRLL